MSIGRRLLAQRQAREWTLEQLAAESQVSAPYLSKIERDRVLPRRDTFKAIVEILGAEARDLLTERDKVELETLGYEPEVAEVAAQLGRLGRADRRRVLDRLHEELGAADEPAPDRRGRLKQRV